MPSFNATVLLAQDALLWQIPVFGTLAIIAGLGVAHALLIRRSKDMGASKRFSRQLTMLGLTGLALVLLILVLTPGRDALRGSLLTFFGILFSALIGISSTTFISNAMAGLLIRQAKSFRTGDFIRVNEEFGRVTERGLFHTEIQTEDRDLVTLPNLFLATHPLRVVRSDGTIVSVILSLGYDVPRTRVEQLLKSAAEHAGLEEPFVHISDLGDYSISYRVAGFLPEVAHLRTARSNLRKSALDCLHADGIEIVSPVIMDQRPLDPVKKMIPARRPSAQPVLADEDGVDAIIFDKADEAQAIESLQAEIESVSTAIHDLAKARHACETEEEGAKLDSQIKEAERRLSQIERALERSKSKEEGA